MEIVSTTSGEILVTVKDKLVRAVVTREGGMMQEMDEVKPVRRVLVEDAQKKERMEKERSLHDRLRGKAVTELNQTEIAELILLLAGQAWWMSREGFYNREGREGIIHE